MNTKKIVKILVAIVISTMLITSCNMTYAATTKPSTFTGTSTTAFNNMGNRIIGGIQAIGTIASVAILIVLGIKYMMGSAEEKAEYKKTMIPYLVGAILIFAATNIAGFVYNFASSIS